MTNKKPVKMNRFFNIVSIILNGKYTKRADKIACSFCTVCSMISLNELLYVVYIIPGIPPPIGGIAGSSFLISVITASVVINILKSLNQSAEILKSIWKRILIIISNDKSRVGKGEFHP